MKTALFLYQCQSAIESLEHELMIASGKKENEIKLTYEDVCCIRDLLREAIAE